MTVEVKQNSKRRPESIGKGLPKSLLPALFIGASGFVFIFQMMTSLNVEGNLFPVKILVSLLAGVIGFVATLRSGIFHQGW